MCLMPRGRGFVDKVSGRYALLKKFEYRLIQRGSHVLRDPKVPPLKLDSCFEQMIAATWEIAAWRDG